MNPAKPTILCALAHPDDESLGFGPAIAKYAAEGAEVYLIMATRGQRGWKGKPEEYPGPEALGQIRTEELLQAAEVLGIREVFFLDYMDGQLDQADSHEAIAKIAAHIGALRPQVVLTFGPDGSYGHPDHIAISQFTTAAVMQAATVHTVSKLYYSAESKAVMEAYQSVFGDLKSKVDGVERRFAGWEEWAITTHLETSAYVETIKQAILCHRSQLRGYDRLLQLSPEPWQYLYGHQHFYRVFSLVNGGRKIERGLFEGLAKAFSVSI